MSGYLLEVMEDGGAVADLLCGPQWEAPDCSWLHEDYVKVGVAGGILDGTCGEGPKTSLLLYTEDWVGTRRMVVVSPEYLMGISVVGEDVFAAGLAACYGEEKFVRLAIPTGSLVMTPLDCPVADFEMTVTAQTQFGIGLFGEITVHKEGVMVCAEAMP